MTNEHYFAAALITLIVIGISAGIYAYKDKKSIWFSAVASMVAPAFALGWALMLIYGVKSLQTLIG